MNKKEQAALRTRNLTRLLERYTLIRQISTMSNCYIDPEDDDLGIRAHDISKQADDIVAMLYRMQP